MSTIEEVYIKEEVLLEDDEDEEDEEEEDALAVQNDGKNGSQSIPPHSKSLYWNTYNTFMDWMATRGVEEISEEILLDYFEELSKKYKPPSLWSKYSMLKSTFKVKYNIDIHEYPQLLNYLKQENKGYEPKKSEVLTVANVKTFLSEAPDYEFLGTKVALIIALFGGCRHSDLVKLSNDDVEQHGDIMKITLRNRRNKIKTFIIEGEMLQPILNYRSLRPKNVTENRFFLSYRNGKCNNGPLGKNKFGAMPKEIAQFLNLPNSELYTGHSFKRSSATLCKEQGISLSDLRRLSSFQKCKPERERREEIANIKRKAEDQVGKITPGPSKIMEIHPKKVPKLNEAPLQLTENTRIYVSTLPVINDKLILYSYWRSSCAYRVRIALNLKEIPYDIKPINLEKGGGEQHSDEFRKINPMARVPALHIDNHTLIESQNILHYLEETRPDIYPLMPSDPIKRSRVREICEVITSGIQPLQNVGVLTHLTEQQKKEWPQFWITRGFMAVEELLSTCAGKYCVGDEITLADCCLVPQIYNAKKFRVDVKPFSKILEIDKNLEKHPAFVKAHPNNQPDYPRKVGK